MCDLVAQMLIKNHLRGMMLLICGEYAEACGFYEQNRVAEQKTSSSIYANEVWVE